MSSRDLPVSLRTELLELDVEAVEPVSAGPAPDDARAIEALDAGGADRQGRPDVESLTTLVRTVRGWLGDGDRKVRIELDGDVLELSGVSTKSGSVSSMPGSSVMPEPEQSAARREALIVAADAYEDPKLARFVLRPATPRSSLGCSATPTWATFRSASLDEPDHVVRRKLSEFFRDRGRDDLLLLHVACHGLKDEDGTLYFASSNTAVEHLEATAIPSEFVNHQMTKSRSRRIVLLLDCCFGGAFARGLVHRGGDSVAIKEEFDGQGRVVLTASRAMEYAFEGDNLEGDAQPLDLHLGGRARPREWRGRSRRRQPRLGRRAVRLCLRPRPRDDAEPDAQQVDLRRPRRSLPRAQPLPPEPEPAPLPAELRAAMESPFATCVPARPKS